MEYYIAMISSFLLGIFVMDFLWAYKLGIVKNMYDSIRNRLR